MILHSDIDPRGEAFRANAPALSGFTIGAAGRLSPMPAAATPSSLGGAQNIAITR